MNRVVQWIVPVALAASPWAVYAQSTAFNSAGLPGFGPMLSALPSIQTTVTPGIGALSSTFGTGASTLPTIGSPAIGTPTLPTIGTPTLPTIGTPTLSTIGTPTMPTIGAPTQPSIGTPLTPTIGTPTLPTIGTSTTPTIGTPALPSIGTPTVPTIGVQPMPPVGPSTSLIGSGTIGTPTIVSSTVGSLGQFASTSGNPLLSPTTSPSAGSAPVRGSGSGSSSSGAGAASDLSCLQEDFICNGVVVVRP